MLTHSPVWRPIWNVQALPAWLWPAACYYGVPTGKMASRKWRHSSSESERKLHEDMLTTGSCYVYTYAFQSIQHWKVFLIYNLNGLGLVGAPVAPEIVREVGWKIVSRNVNTAQKYLWGEVDLMLWSKDVKYCREYTCQQSGMWTVALISPVTFSDVSLGSVADSNMATAAVARVYVLARPSVWQADDFGVLNISFTQKRPEIVRNTCQWSRNSIVPFYLQCSPPKHIWALSVVKLRAD